MEVLFTLFLSKLSMLCLSFQKKTLNLQKSNNMHIVPCMAAGEDHI